MKFFINQKGLSCERGRSSERGQAALMDSLFFLAIVSVICTSLFFFTVNYGKSMEQQVNSFYSRDFAADSLKVISYINVMRNGDDIFSARTTDTKEYDYLLAIMKEDYADKKSFSCPTQRAIKSTLASVLKPFDDSIDYGYYLFNQSSNQYLFLLMAVHECTGDGCTSSAPGAESSVERKYYYCTPQSRDVLEKLVFPYVGQVDTSIGKVSFAEPESKEGSKGTPYIMGLSMWVSKDLAVLNNLSAQNSEFHCTEIPAACTAQIP